MFGLGIKTNSSGSEDCVASSFSFNDRYGRVVRFSDELNCSGFFGW
jgi:hypothetical protein